MLEQIPLRRFGVHADVTAATAFFATLAGNYVTGQTNVVDGVQSA